MTITSAARAAASRRNGARSRGPVSAAGKARSAQNAMKHGLRAQSVLLSDESAAEFADLAGALRAELAPVGALQTELALRVLAAAWRARRANRVEAAALERHVGAGGGRQQRQAALGTGLIRDGYGPRTLETLVRHRGSALAELFRALGALRTLQADTPELLEARSPEPCRHGLNPPPPLPNEPGKTN